METCPWPDTPLNAHIMWKGKSTWQQSGSSITFLFKQWCMLQLLPGISTDKNKIKMAFALCLHSPSQLRIIRIRIPLYHQIWPPLSVTRRVFTTGVISIIAIFQEINHEKLMAIHCPNLPSASTGLLIQSQLELPSGLHKVGRPPHCDRNCATDPTNQLVPAVPIFAIYFLLVQLRSDSGQLPVLIEETKPTPQPRPEDSYPKKKTKNKCTRFLLQSRFG